MDRPKLSTLQRRVRALGGGPISIFSCCINPRKAAASGLYERVRRTLGIGVEGLTDEEKSRREARRSKLLSESQQFSAEVLPHIISGLGPAPLGAR